MSAASAVSLSLAAGQQPKERAITRVPNEVWSIITSFCPDPKTMGRLQCTSRAFRDRINEEANLYLKNINSHPFLRSICDHSSLIVPIPHYKGRIPVLDQHLKFAAALRNTIAGIHGGAQFVHKSFSRDAAILRDRLQRGIALSPFDPRASLRDPLRSLAKQANPLSWDDLFIAAVLKGDARFLSQFNLDIIDREYIDFAAYFSLLNGNIAMFKALLKATSIFSDEPPPAQEGLTPRGMDVLTTFLILAAETNRMDVFQELINLRKPFSHNAVLVKAAEMNRGEAIQKLLTSGLAFHETFIEVNGLNERHSHTPGLHTALMCAANRNSEEAMNAILQARPGQAIDRQILEHVRDLLQNHGPFDQPILHTDWQDRENNPNRDQIVHRLNQEIGQRFPAPADAEAEAPLVAAGPADAEAEAPLVAAGPAVAEAEAPLVAAGPAVAEAEAPLVAAGPAVAEEEAAAPQEAIALPAMSRRDLIAGVAIAAFAVLWNFANYYFS